MSLTWQLPLCLASDCAVLEHPHLHLLCRQVWRADFKTLTAATTVLFCDMYLC